jgi:NADH-quinone oxidoreductase subunit N
MGGAAMTTADFTALLPYLVLTGAVLAVLLAITIFRSHRLAAGLTLAGLALALTALPIAASAAPRAVTPLIMVDGFTLFFVGLLLCAALASAGLAYGYLERRRIQREEFYLLLLTATLGGCVLPASAHFASLFLSLELLTVSLYGMIAYLRTEPLGVEAGIKYLILAAVSSAFLLFGAALIYADRGTLVLGRILLPETATAGLPQPAMLAAGLAMVLVGIGFKLAVVPFHMWIPDIYQGAPAPVAAFMATVSKGAVFALLMRIFSLYDLRSVAGVYAGLAAIAVLSMFAGNWLALLQTNVKRMLAYSSIAHFGYLMVALLAAGASSVTAGALYLAAYFTAILAAFGAVGAIPSAAGEAQDLEAYRGLFRRRPGTAFILTAALVSLIGIPLTAGFIGKAYLLLAGLGSAVWLLAVVLIVTSAIGLYYYLRVILAMAQPPGAEDKSEQRAAPESRLGSLVLAALALGILWLGLYPAPVLDLIQRTAGGVLVF